MNVINQTIISVYSECVELVNISYFLHPPQSTNNYFDNRKVSTANRVQFYSCCDTKRRLGRAGSSKAFFWYDNDKNLKACFLA